VAIGTASSFVPIVTEADPDLPAVSTGSAAASLEIEISGAVVRVMPGVNAELLTAVLRAVRCSLRAT
jgi:hypothetical protein